MLSFILLLALLALIFLLRKPLKSMLIDSLDKRSDRIRDELNEAEKLHKDAKALLEQHQAKLAEGENSAAEILAHAEGEAKRLEVQLQEDLERSLKRREELALERIAQEEARALRDVRARASDLAIRTTRQLLTDRLGGDGAEDVMKNAIKEVQQKLA